MALKIYWSDEAVQTFESNIAYLDKNWSPKEVRKFIIRCESVIAGLEEHPEIYPASTKNKRVRRAVINKHIALYYRYYPSKKMIALLSFWNTHRDDKHLKH